VTNAKQGKRHTEAVIEAAIGRDISYTYVPGVLIGLGVVLWQAKGPALQRPA